MKIQKKNHPFRVSKYHFHDINPFHGMDLVLEKLYFSRWKKYNFHLNYNILFVSIGVFYFKRMY